MDSLDLNISFEIQKNNNVLVGEVISVKDGVAFVTGLSNIRVGEMVQFLNKSKNIFGMVLNLESDHVGDDQEIKQDGGVVLALGGLGNLFSTRTYLNRKIPLQIIKRGMLSGRSASLVKSAYTCLSVLANDETLAKMTKKNHKPLLASMVKTSLDYNKGIPQHQTALLTHITNQKFDVLDFVEPFKEITGLKNINAVPAMVDCRILKELPIIPLLFRYFENGIQSLQLNSDNIPGDFYKQKQKNHDFYVMIKDKFITGNIICRPHDEKGGMSMLDNTTRGHLGAVYYTDKGEHVQMTQTPITCAKLLQYNRERLYRLEKVIEVDGAVKIFTNCIDSNKEVLEKNKNITDYEHMSRLNTKIQQSLWETIHCDSRFKRSVSYIFIEKVTDEPFDQKFQSFKLGVVTRLGNRLYNLDKVQDRRDVYRALVASYRETFDPNIIKKLEYLHYEMGITLNPHFFNDIITHLKSSL